MFAIEKSACAAKTKSPNAAKAFGGREKEAGCAVAKIPSLAYNFPGQNHNRRPCKKNRQLHDFFSSARNERRMSRMRAV